MIKDTYIRKKIKKTIIASILILIISIVIFVMYKYSLEGEKSMPFEIGKMVIISSAQTDKLILQENYVADIIQKNDFYLYIEKNENYSEEIIKSITIDNFNVNKNSQIGTIKVFRPSMNADKMYEYIEQYETDKIVYMGGLVDNSKSDTSIVSNQGGTIYFSIANVDLGKITYNDNENIEATGKLLNKLNLSNDQIKFKISFDIIIELETGNKYKATINLELPEGNILQNGVNKQEYVNDFLFKRM